MLRLRYNFVITLNKNRIGSNILLLNKIVNISRALDSAKSFTSQRNANGSVLNLFHKYMMNSSVSLFLVGFLDTSEKIFLILPS